MSKQHLVFDIEIIGSKKPVVLFCVKNIEAKWKKAFWLHKPGDLDAFEKLLHNPKYTWISFNGENFDRPIIAAALMGYDEHGLKALAEAIIQEEMRSWKTYKEFGIDFIDYDHIDLIEVAPGVMISLKVYMGRLGYPTMIDMPFHHDTDLKPNQLPIVEQYCFNDIGGTELLFTTLKDEIELRKELSAEHGIDLRSKSDAQIAEAILKNRVGIRNGDKHIPSFVTYSAPSFIVTKNQALIELIDLLEQHYFKINRMNGSPEVPDFLAEPLRINNGFYQVGVGGLHSTHDNNLYLEASDKLMLSDFDVASYYPNIMMKAGLIPKLGGNKGEIFLDEYRKIYEQRIEAKRAGNKKIANSLKITLNGTFGKLGNIYCSFYSPDLMLAVTLTGQLNLLCLIDELEKIKGVQVKSANTDGILVAYPPAARERVLKVFVANAKRTGFEYEETPYSKIGFKDVNNYIAITDERPAIIIEGSSGKIVEQKIKPVTAKSKGLYASNDPKENPLYLMKNPTMEVCSKMVIEYLRDGTRPEVAIKKYKDMKDFVAIRNVKGGGIQFDKYKLVDDWEQTAPRQWTYPGMTTKPVSRVSRPPKREVGVGGIPFGRVARWYMTTESLPPLSYIGSGNRVPKTEGAKVCMTLPKKQPKDLNYQWYIDETYRILTDLGVSL